MGKADADKLNFWTKAEYDTFISNIDRESRYFVIFEILFWTRCREGVKEKLERMKELCRERNSLYEKQNDLKGQKWKLERALEI